MKDLDEGQIYSLVECDTKRLIDIAHILIRDYGADMSVCDFIYHSTRLIYRSGKWMLENHTFNSTCHIDSLFDDELVEPTVKSEDGTIMKHSLRDHFAGLAMQACISHSGSSFNDYYLSIKSYEIADAMLKARKEAGNG